MNIPQLFSVNLAITPAKLAPAKQVASLVFMAGRFPRVEDFVSAISEPSITPRPKLAPHVLTPASHAHPPPPPALLAIPPPETSFPLPFPNASAKLGHFRTELLVIHACQHAPNVQTRRHALFAGQAQTEIWMETTFVPVSLGSMTNWALY